MLPHPVLRPEDGLAALVLAVEVLGVLHLALLEPAALVLVEPEEVLLPDVLGDGLGELHERDGVSLDLGWREGLGQGQGGVFGPAVLLQSWLSQRWRGGARGQGPAGGWRPLRVTGLLLWAGWSTRREGEESVLS